jgi:hypothetical protein
MLTAWLDVNIGAFTDRILEPGAEALALVLGPELEEAVEEDEPAGT